MLSIIIVSFITLFASFVGTITGFGLSTIMLPTLLLFLPFAQVVLLVSIIHWFHGGLNTLLFRTGIDWHLFAYFGIPGMITTVLGARLLGMESQQLLPFLGLFLIAYSLLLLLAPAFQLPHSRVTCLIGGSLSGFFAGIFGMRGTVRSMFLTAFNLPKIVYIATTSMISFAVDSTRMLVYINEGINLDQSLWLGLLFFIPASFLGSYIARSLLHKIPAQSFRTIIAVFLLLIGIRLLVFPT
ncbi:MAG: sulfite exporter TauE/SafE family protein [Candidatus Babeliales bacterium]